MLLLAAGRGTRLGTSIAKAYVELDDRPLLVHAAERLARCADLRAGSQLVLVINPDDEPLLEPWLRRLQELGDVRTTHGGATRQESMTRGLRAADPEVDLVLVHDAARALLPVEATRACLGAAARTGAALLAVPVTDTIKHADDEVVTATVDRDGLWLAQTPQVIRRDLLLEALERAADDGFDGTDDVSLVEHCGHAVTIVPGAPTNLKITRPDDLPLAAAILQADLA